MANILSRATKHPKNPPIIADALTKPKMQVHHQRWASAMPTNNTMPIHGWWQRTEYTKITGITISGQIGKRHPAAEHQPRNPTVMIFFTIRRMR
ncbi:hypothetical protein [Verrucomicrobium sp. BvORR106]|uniref:hypothetical protein n=1 Tax=Verrucomicrobium sp. BvORR106 TaxID=1403819 RepID=UPI000570C0EB|nr:hypothetical protein [Verrucomicrobium sp. BvORR106]